MHITLSALGPTIEEQVAAMGLVHVGGKSLELLDRIGHALTIAHIHGCLTDSEVNRARARLIKNLKLRQPAKALEE